MTNTSAMDMRISPPVALRRAIEFCHDDVALLDHTHDLQLRTIDELGRAVDYSHVLGRSKEPIGSDLLEADRLEGGGFKPGTWD